MDTTPVTKKEDLQFKKEFITNWQSFRKYDESPLETYFRNIDLTYRGTPDADYFDRAFNNEDPRYMGKLLTADFRFKNDAKLNVVASISDVIQRTGTGKSTAGLRFGLVLASIFGTKFDLSHLCWTQKELDKKLENAENKTIWDLDEQLKTRVGIGSKTTDLRLEDIEDTQRSSQVCVIYCSPQLRSHNHFFCFETHQVERIKNPVCLSCKTPTNCQNCKMPFYERSGYIKSIYLMLKTKRLTTGLPVARGLIRVSVPPPELMQEYWKAKDINVQKIRKKEDDSWQDLKSIAINIFNLKKDSLIKKKKTGGYLIKSKSAITGAIFDVIGWRRYPNDVMDLLLDQIIQLLESYVVELDAKSEFETENKESAESSDA